MPRYPAHIRLVVALVWTSLQLFEGSAFAQSRPSDLKSEVDTLKEQADHHKDGIVIWENPEGATVPFLLRLNTLTGGYTGVPGSRSLVSTFPFFQPTDRSMADNFFRPGFTQGIWANGEPVDGLSYLAFVGNGLNTMNISATKIDQNLLLSGSVWWEPLEVHPLGTIGGGQG